MAAAATAGLAGCIGALNGQSELDQQLETDREATRQYQDPANAHDDGFVAGGSYVPGMGWHWQHPGRGQAAAEEGFYIEQPNLLTYLETDDGLQLGAVEWGAPVAAVPERA